VSPLTTLWCHLPITLWCPLINSFVVSPLFTLWCPLLITLWCLLIDSSVPSPLITLWYPSLISLRCPHWLLCNVPHWLPHGYPTQLEPNLTCEFSIPDHGISYHGCLASLLRNVMWDMVQLWFQDKRCDGIWFLSVSHVKVSQSTDLQCYFHISALFLYTVKEQYQNSSGERCAESPTSWGP
jgi:hypothetical protein